MSVLLKDTPLTQLRGIAQSFNVPDIFSKDALQLAQAIELKQQAMIPVPPIAVPLPEYDARLMDKPPAKKMNATECQWWATEYINRGMKVTVTDEMWRISFGKKTDQGTLRMPPRHFLACCAKVMA